VTMVSSRVSADRSSMQNAAAADVPLPSPSPATAAVVAADAAAAAAPAASEVVVTDEYRLAVAMDVPVLDPYAALSGTAAAASTAAAAAAAATLAAADGGGSASAARLFPAPSLAAAAAAAGAGEQPSGDELMPQAGPLSRSDAAVPAEPPVPMLDVDDGGGGGGGGGSGGGGGRGEGARGPQSPLADSAPTLELQWQQSHPLAWLNAPGTEEKAFPRLFPYGVGGFRTAREHRMPLTRYFHTRLINTDSKFRREPEYLLWAEASLRHKEVLDAVHLALRRVPTGIVVARRHTDPYPSPINSHLLCSCRGVHNTGRGPRLQHRSNEAGSNSAVDNGGGGEGGAVPADDGAGGGAAVQIGSPAPLPTAGEVRRNDTWMARYGGLHYLNRVRGTVPYWNSVRLELTAMIAQLGPPAIFLTLNPPRPREWPEFFVEISAFGPNTTIDMVCSTRTRANEPARVSAWPLPHRLCLLLSAGWSCGFCCCDQVMQRTNRQLTEVASRCPVEWALHFDRRLREMLRELTGASSPIGTIRDYFVAIEEQARGWLHAHMLLWSPRAPNLHAPSRDRDFVQWWEGVVHATVRIPEPVAAPSSASGAVRTGGGRGDGRAASAPAAAAAAGGGGGAAASGRGDSDGPHEEDDGNDDDGLRAEAHGAEQQGSAYVEIEQERSTGQPSRRLVIACQRHACRSVHCGTVRCRYGFPRHVPVGETKVVRDPFQNRFWYEMKRQPMEARINPYVPAILARWRGNMDIAAVATGNHHSRRACTAHAARTMSSVSRSLPALCS
jgi:hypothetical protein